MCEWSRHMDIDEWFTTLHITMHGGEKGPDVRTLEEVRDHQQLRPDRKITEKGCHNRSPMVKNF